MDDAFWGVLLIVLAGAIPVTLMTLGALAFAAVVRLNGALERANRRIAALEAAVEDIRTVGVRVVLPSAFEPEAAPAAPPLPHRNRRLQAATLRIAGACGLLTTAAALLWLWLSTGGFGPAAQFGIVAALGIAAIVGAWLWRDAHRAAAGGLAAAGAGLLVAAPWLGRFAFSPSLEAPLLSGPAAAGLAAIAALAPAALSLRHGPGFAALAAAAFFAAPWLAGLEAISPAALFFGLSVGAAALLALAVRRGWGWLAWAGLAGSLGWAAAWGLTAFSLAGHGFAAAHLAILAALYCAAAWAEADAAWPAGGALARAWAAALGASLGIGALSAAGGHAAATLALATLLTGGLAAAATARAGFAPIAALAFAIIAGSLLAWRLTAEELRLFFATAGALGLIASVAGGAMAARGAGPFGGALAALGPVFVLFVAQDRAGPAAPDLAWSAAAAFLAGLNAFAFLQRGGQTAFGLGALAAALMAAAFSLGGLSLATAAALLAAGAAWMDRRRPSTAMAAATGALAIFAAWGLSLSGAALRAEPWGWPILNALLAAYGVSLAALYAAAQLCRGRAAWLSHALEVAMLLTGVAAAVMQVRHLANGGVMDAPYLRLEEMAGHTLALLGLAIALAARPGPKRPAAAVGEAAAIAAAGLNMVLAGLYLMHPWWGLAPATAWGPPLVVALALAYAAPTALVCVYAWLARRGGFDMRAAAAEGGAIALAFMWLTLEVRRAFTGPDMAGPTSAAAEPWAISAAWLAMAGGLFALSGTPGRRWMRALALALAAATAGKALLLDAARLSGLAQGLAFAGILSALALALAALAARRFAPRLLGFSRRAALTTPAKPATDRG